MARRAHFTPGNGLPTYRDHVTRNAPSAIRRTFDSHAGAAHGKCLLGHASLLQSCHAPIGAAMRRSPHLYRLESPRASYRSWNRPACTGTSGRPRGRESRARWQQAGGSAVGEAESHARRCSVCRPTISARPAMDRCARWRCASRAALPTPERPRARSALHNGYRRARGRRTVSRRAATPKA